MYIGKLENKGLFWDLFIDDSPQSPRLNYKDIREARSVQGELRAGSSDMHGHLGAALNHTAAIDIFCQHWSVIVEDLHNIMSIGCRIGYEGLTMEPEAFPEVTMKGSLFGGEIVHRADCVGNDRFGNFFITELGRGHKIAQLEQQLYLARTIYPSASFHGLLGIYHLNERQEGRLSLRCY